MKLRQIPACLTMQLIGLSGLLLTELSAMRLIGPRFGRQDDTKYLEPRVQLALRGDVPENMQVNVVCMSPRTRSATSVVLQRFLST